MTATALLNFVQGGNAPGQGVALSGVTGTLVSISNGDDTDVQSWQLDLVYTDPQSAISTMSAYAFSDVPAAVAAVVTPDVNGSYRWMLSVWDAENRPGTPTDIDIRNIVVPEANGFIVPPSQIWPRPLPDPASGSSNAKPNELNINAQPFGWGGTGSNDGLLGSLIRKVDALEPTSVVLPPTPARYVDPGSSLDPSLANGSLDNPYLLPSTAVADLGSDGVIYLFGGLLSDTLAIPASGKYVLEGLGYAGPASDAFPVYLDGTLVVAGNNTTPTVVRARRIQLNAAVSNDGLDATFIAEDCIFSTDINTGAEANLTLSLIRSTCKSATCAQFTAIDSTITHNLTVGAGGFTADRCTFNNGGSPQTVSLAGTFARLSNCQISSGTNSSPLTFSFASSGGILSVDADTYGQALTQLGTGGLVVTNGTIVCRDQTRFKTIIHITGSISLNNTHVSGYLRCDDASPASITIPLNSGTPIPIGSEFDGMQVGAGQYTFVVTGGVTMINAESLITRKQGSAWSLKKTGIDTWELAGDFQLL